MSKLHNAAVAYLEARTVQGWEDYSPQGLVTHYAGMFGVTEAELQQEVNFADLEGLAVQVRDGEVSLADACDSI